MNDMEEKKVDSGGANPEEEMSMEQLLSQQGEVNDKLYSREIIQVKVVEVNSEYVFADIGEKKEAVIPVSEFEGKLPQPGEEVMAVLEKKGDENRSTILSHKKAREKISWQWLEKAFAAKERIKGRVTEHVKGGYIVDVSGLRGFMPLSLSELGGSPRHYLPVNAKVKFYVTDMDAKARKIIVSRRQVLEEDEKIRRQEVMSQTREGQVARVVVSKVIDSGIFVRYQGMDGFVNLSDLAWKDPQEALKSYKRGQRIKVKVLKADKENQKLVFGVKQTMPNPLDLLKRKFPFKTSLRVKIVEPVEGGLKAHVVSDIYGFIPETDYGYDGVPQKDEEVNAVVVGVNPQTYELKLSMKRYQELEDRKRVQQYLKGAPKLTLGQILTEADENAGDQGKI